MLLGYFAGKMDGDLESSRFGVGTAATAFSDPSIGGQLSPSCCDVADAKGVGANMVNKYLKRTGPAARPVRSPPRAASQLRQMRGNYTRNAGLRLVAGDGLAARRAVSASAAICLVVPARQTEIADHEQCSGVAVDFGGGLECVDRAGGIDNGRAGIDGEWRRRALRRSLPWSRPVPGPPRYASRCIPMDLRRLPPLAQPCFDLWRRAALPFAEDAQRQCDKIQVQDSVAGDGLPAGARQTESASLTIRLMVPAQRPH